MCDAHALFSVIFQLTKLASYFGSGQEVAVIGYWNGASLQPMAICKQI